MRPDRHGLLHRGAIALAAALALLACYGEIEEAPAIGRAREPAMGDDGAPVGSGADGSAGSATGDAGEEAAADCTPLPVRVTRLPDRQLANAMRHLLGLASAPSLRTASSSVEAFIPNKAASVNGAVALELRDVAEAVAAEATAPGSAAIACSGEPRACAVDFVDRVASRAFQAPIDAEQRARLLALYDVGVETYGEHAGGIRLVIEGVLQAPSFLYLRELGEPGAAGELQLTEYELATKLALFLRDALPDDALWRAAETGALRTEAGLRAEVERLLETPEVQANVTAMLRRLFQLDRIHEISKAASITAFTPELVTAMYAETDRFLNDLLWDGPGTLRALLTARTTRIDARMAEHYGVPHPGGDALIEVELPRDQRAGILTQPSVMTIEALPDQSSVVHRGVTLARELLCFHPPTPQASDLEQGQAFKLQEPTERGRAELRAMNMRCRGCHGYFDPLGLAFEHYDTLGRWREVIDTADGEVAVDASSELNVQDLQGPVDGAVELAEMLADSDAVRACMARQFASYALGARIEDAQACTVAPLVTAFERSGGDLRALVEAVAGWDGLSRRSAEETP